MAKMADATSAFQDRSRTTTAVKRRASLNKQSSAPPSSVSQYFSPGDRRLSGTEGRWISPLKQFGLAKEKISKAFRRLSEQLTESEGFLKDIESAKQQNVAQLRVKVQGIKNMLARDQMKVVFFGRTSNGKSTVINALLQNRVLPMGIGHTTNCFCSVAGTEEEEGHLAISESDEKQAVESIKQLAHSLSAEHCLDSSSLVTIYWPQDRCPLLKEDVVLVDSPGIDMDPDLDQWISKHCLDADVFVLVSNAESTIMQTEKNFFHRVSKRLSRPNVFILNNRWDMSETDSEQEFVEKVKQQHVRFNTDFLVKELKVAGEKTARDRVFFVSAREALLVRESRAKGKGLEGLPLVNNWQQRLVEFDTFERKLKECLSSSAIHTKFEKHHQEGQRALKELDQIMQQAEKDCVFESNELGDQLQETERRESELSSKSCDLESKLLSKIKEAAEEVERKITATVSEISLQLSGVANGYSAVFDPGNLEPYLSTLYSTVDEQVFNSGDRKCVQELTDIHSTALAAIAGEYQQMLELSQDELKELVSGVDFSQLTLLPLCGDMCKDFVPDLNFRFSLGMSTILEKFNVGSSSGLQLLNVISGNQYLLLGGALVFGYLISKLVTWEVVLSVGAVFGLLFGYERLTWTDSAKERAIKEQFKVHVVQKLKQHMTASRVSYHGVLENDLRLQLSRFKERVTHCMEQLREDRDSSRKRSQQMRAWAQSAGKLRGALAIVGTDFESFSEQYLQTSLNEEADDPLEGECQEASQSFS